jgi:hypothetical protein
MRVLVILFSIATLTACLSTGPINNKKFGNIKEISDLNGKYINRGDSGTKGPPIYLSRIIWPKDARLDHESIKIIVVTTTSNAQLLIKAMQDNSIAKEQIFTEGKDFTIKSGRIHLLREIGGVSNNFAGVTYTSIDLGLDTSGHGKYRTGEAFVGIALLIPFVAHDTTDVRFSKIEE